MAKAVIILDAYFVGSPEGFGGLRCLDYSMRSKDGSAIPDYKCWSKGCCLIFCPKQ